VGQHRWGGLEKEIQNIPIPDCWRRAGIGPFLKLKVVNPDYERALGQDHFESAMWASIKELQSKGRYGICFLFDEGDYFVNKGWANDALSYFEPSKTQVMP